MKSYELALKKILEAKTIAIFTHANADGDAIGSAFGFYYFLKSINKTADVFCKTTMPNQLKFLNVENILNVKSTNKYDLAISVDCNTAEMMNTYATNFRAIENSIQFDHHQANPSYAGINIVEPTISSACELIAKFLFSTNQVITPEVAKFLLVGLITDTGGFRFLCTSKETINIVSKLLDCTDVPLGYLMTNLFESEDENYLKMYREALNNTKLLYDNKVALIVVDNKFYKETGIDPNCAKNLTRIGTEIKSVIVTALIAEIEPNVCKVSFRSRQHYDCSKCASVFGGGGHFQASGCKIFGNLQDTIDRVVKSMVDGL